MINENLQKKNNSTFFGTVWNVVKQYGPAFLIGAGAGAAGTYVVMRQCEPTPIVVETPQGEITLA